MKKYQQTVNSQVIECSGRRWMAVATLCLHIFGGSGKDKVVQRLPGVPARTALADGADPAGMRPIIRGAPRHKPAHGRADVWERLAAHGAAAPAHQGCGPGPAPGDGARGQGGQGPDDGALSRAVSADSRRRLPIICPLLLWPGWASSVGGAPREAWLL